MSALLHDIRDCHRSKLRAALLRAVPEETHDSIWHVSRALDDASHSVLREMPRRARVISLLYVAALDARRSDAARERRWRRFIGALDAFASETHPLVLRRLVYENADLTNVTAS